MYFVHKFEKNQNFMDNFSPQEDAKGIKFGVFRKLYLSAIKLFRNIFHKSGQELLPIDGGHVKSPICPRYIRDWDWKG